MKGRDLFHRKDQHGSEEYEIRQNHQPDLVRFYGPGKCTTPSGTDPGGNTGHTGPGRLGRPGGSLPSRRRPGGKKLGDTPLHGHEKERSPRMPLEGHPGRPRTRCARGGGRLRRGLDTGGNIIDTSAFEITSS